MKPRSKPGFKTDYLVICEGDDLPFEVLDTKGEAEALCERRNAPPLEGIATQHNELKSAVQSAA